MPPFFQRLVSASPTTAAVLIMLTGMLLFTANDALGKWLTGSYSVGQLIFFRSMVALLVLSPFVWRAGRARIFVVERPWTSPASSPADGGRLLRVLLRRVLAAAGRRHDLLPGRADLCRGFRPAVAWRACRLATLVGDRLRVSRGACRARTVCRHVHIGGDRLSRRQSRVRVRAPDGPVTARHAKHCDDILAIRRRPGGRDRDHTVFLDAASADAMARSRSPRDFWRCSHMSA